MKLHISLSNDEINEIYNVIKCFHNKHLKIHGIKLPSLTKSNKFVKDALVLVYLAKGYPSTRAVSKEELTSFMREYYPNTNDVQQARHLGAQSGWWIVAGGRDNIVIKLKRGFYQLHTLSEPYPGYTKGHRLSNVTDWEDIKNKYNLRCATCGSSEGQPHLHWTATKTKLQKAHKDPSKPLDLDNIIPQCQKCNQADRNRWVYDEKGRVVELADANFVRNFSKDVRMKLYKILYNEFKGIDPKNIR